MTLTPSGAQPIIAARLEGKRPADTVVVSFLGRLPWDFGDCPIVYPHSRGYDWRFLIGLRTMVVVKPGADVKLDLEAIVRYAAPYVTLVEPERKLAASILSIKPVQLWRFTERHPDWQGLFA